MDEEREARFKRNILNAVISSMSRVDTREGALGHLSTLCVTLNDIGSVLWNAPGVVSVLLYELTSTFYNIHPPTLTHYQVTRLCNTMNIINCIVSDRATSIQFVEAHMPQYIFPFLHSKDNGRVTPLKCSVLVVIATLLSHKEPSVVNYLLSTDIIPLCLRFMEYNCQVIKTAGTYLLHHMLKDDVGLEFICETYNRFSHVALILGRIVLSLQIEPSPGLMKNVLGCYLRLAESTRARQALKECVPMEILDLPTFSQFKDLDIANDLLKLKNIVFPKKNETIDIQKNVCL